MPKIYTKTKIFELNNKFELIFGSFEDRLCLLGFKNRSNRLIIDNRLKKRFKR